MSDGSLGGARSELGGRSSQPPDSKLVSLEKTVLGRERKDFVSSKNEISHIDVDSRHVVTRPDCGGPCSARMNYLGRRRPLG